MTAKHTSDLELCYACDRILTDYEEIYCGPCQSRVLAEWDPSDADLARRDAMITRGYRHLAAILAGAITGLLVLAVGLTLLTHDAQAQDLTATRTINGAVHEWTLPEAGCRLLRGWEDHSAQAWCPSGLMTYDPDGSDTRDPETWYAAGSTR